MLGARPARPAHPGLPPSRGSPAAGRSVRLVLPLADLALPRRPAAHPRWRSCLASVRGRCLRRRRRRLKTSGSTCSWPRHAGRMQVRRAGRAVMAGGGGAWWSVCGGGAAGPCAGWPHAAPLGAGLLTADWATLSPPPLLLPPRRAAVCRRGPRGGGRSHRVPGGRRLRLPPPQPRSLLAWLPARCPGLPAAHPS